MKIGDQFEFASWFSERERAMALKVCSAAMHRAQETNGVIFGPWRWSEKAPGEERVPNPPKDAPVGVKILVVEADVVAFRPNLNAYRFSRDIDQKDLAALRNVTQRQYRKANPRLPALTVDELDNIIDQIGPKVGLDMLRSDIGKQIH